MITEAAWEYARKAKAEKSLTQAQRLSKLAFDELFENCQPTEKEFDNFASMLILSGAALWKLVLYIPQWNRRPTKRALDGAKAPRKSKRSTGSPHK